tara:strand:+ start:7731 stop:8375 length:645 start_codon:yes stop_codon:yes gene_type:complete
VSIGGRRRAAQLRRAAVGAAALVALHLEGTFIRLGWVWWRRARDGLAVFCAPRREPSSVRLVVDPEACRRIATAVLRGQGISDAVIGRRARERVGAVDGAKVAIVHRRERDALSLAGSIDTRSDRFVRRLCTRVDIALLAVVGGAPGRVLRTKRLVLRFNVDIGALATLPTAIARGLTANSALAIARAGVHLIGWWLGRNGLAIAFVFPAAAKH